MKVLLKNWDQFLIENKDIKKVAKAILYIDNKILLLKNDRGWDLPGGHLEKDEDIEDGLVREIEEETGLKIKKESLRKLSYQYEYIDFFEVHIDIGVPNISKEHTGYKLIGKDAVKEHSDIASYYKRAISATGTE